MLETMPEVMLSPAIERALQRENPTLTTTLTITAEDMELARPRLRHDNAALEHCAAATAIRRTFGADTVYHAYHDGHFYLGDKCYRLEGERALGTFVHRFMEACYFGQRLPEPATFAITVTRYRAADGRG